MYQRYSKNSELEHIDITELITFIAGYLRHFGSLIFGKCAPDVVLIDDYSKDPTMPVAYEYVTDVKKSVFAIYKKTLDIRLTHLEICGMTKEERVRIFIMILFGLIRCRVQKEYGMRDSQFLVITHKVMSDVYAYCPNAERLANALAAMERSPAEQDQEIVGVLCTELSYRASGDSDIDNCIKRLLVCNRQTFADEPDFVANIFNIVSESSSEFVS